MEILKRNGDRSKYDGSKIVLAIKMAMADISSIVSDDVIDDIESDIQDEIEDSEDIWTVEMISDRVEKSLMSYVSTNDKFYDVAKSYILYRNKQKKERDEVYPYKILTKEFLSKYKHAKNPMSQLGSFVYYRTYSRWLLDKQRREYWWETVARSVDYNCSLAATSKNEAEKLYDNIFNLRQFLSGRTFWVGGTPIVENYKTSNFNCAMTVIDNFNAYKDMFYLLMVGSGVGFRVLKSDVSKLPKVRNEINVLHEYYTPLPKHARREYTGLEFTGDVATINVGDSKEAWSQALDFFIKLHYKKEYRKMNNIIVNYNSVRPYGERLKTFGGFASGHESMLNMLTKIDKIFKKSSSKLKTIDCMDMANIIAENVVVGGVRRSAQICMCDADDDDVINAKSNLYTQIGDEWVIDKSISHRSMSNNSIYYFKKPTKERLHWQIEKQRYSGEPAFYNAEAGIIRRSDFDGTNP